MWAALQERRGRGGQQSPRGCRGRPAVTSWEGRPGARRDRGQLQACGFGGRREQGSQAELGGEDRLDGWREDSEVWGSLTWAGGSTRHRGHGGSPPGTSAFSPVRWTLVTRAHPPCHLVTHRPAYCPQGNPSSNSPAQGKALGSPRRLACWGDPGLGAGRTPRPPLAPGPPPCLLLPQLSRALLPGADGASCVAG